MMGLSRHPFGGHLGAHIWYIMTLVTTLKPSVKMHFTCALHLTVEG